MFFAGIPCQRSIPSNNLSILRLHNRDGSLNVVTFFVEFKSWEIVLAGSIKKVKIFDVLFGEEGPNISMVLSDFTVETGDVVGSKGA